MKKHYMRAYVAPLPQTRAGANRDGEPIRFVAASEGVKRDGLDLDMRGAQLDSFLANPVFLWGHDYRGDRLPIGRVISVEVRGDELLTDVVFDQKDPFAKQVEDKYRRGFLNAVSVGWATLEMKGARVTKWEMLDLSAVPVPGDAKALKVEEARMLAETDVELDQVLNKAARILEAEADEERVWDRIAPQMVRLFCSAQSISVDEHHTQYARLAKLYRKLGKEPPEYRSRQDLAALGAAELMGLFLEGEPSMAPEHFMARDNQDTRTLLKHLVENQKQQSRLLEEIAVGLRYRNIINESPIEEEDDELTLLEGLLDTIRTNKES